MAGHEAHPSWGTDTRRTQLVGATLGVLHCLCSDTKLGSKLGSLFWELKPIRSICTIWQLFPSREKGNGWKHVIHQREIAVLHLSHNLSATADLGRGSWSFQRAGNFSLTQFSWIFQSHNLFYFCYERFLIFVPGGSDFLEVLDFRARRIQDPWRAENSWVSKPIKG